MLRRFCIPLNILVIHKCVNKEEKIAIYEHVSVSKFAPYSVGNGPIIHNVKLIIYSKVPKKCQQTQIYTPRVILQINDECI